MEKQSRNAKHGRDSAIYEIVVVANNGDAGQVVTLSEEKVASGLPF